MKAVKAKRKIKKKKTDKTPFIQFQLFIFFKPTYSQKKFSRTSTIHPSVFRGRALWADSVSPQKNTIAPRDQFKPIRIGEDLVVNYKRWWFFGLINYDLTEI